MTGALHADQYTVLITSRSVLLRMSNVSDRNRRENQNTLFIFNNFFFENRAIYKIELQNFIEPDRPQMVIWPMCIACWRPNTSNTHSEYVVLIDLPLQKWLPRALQCYIIRTFPVLLTLRCGILFVFLQYIIKEFNPSTH